MSIGSNIPYEMKDNLNGTTRSYIRGGRVNKRGTVREGDELARRDLYREMRSKCPSDVGNHVK